MSATLQQHKINVYVFDILNIELYGVDKAKIRLIGMNRLTLYSKKKVTGSIGVNVLEFLSGLDQGIVITEGEVKQRK